MLFLVDFYVTFHARVKYVLALFSGSPPSTCVWPLTAQESSCTVKGYTRALGGEPRNEASQVLRSSSYVFCFVHVLFAYSKMSAKKKRRESEVDTISSQTALNWLKAERPKTAIYPHQSEYCDYCSKIEVSNFQIQWWVIRYKQYELCKFNASSVKYARSICM